MYVRLWDKAKNSFKAPKVDAASLHDNINNDDSKENGIEHQNEHELKHSIKKNIGFRERKIIEYENRIRHYSTP